MKLPFFALALFRQKGMALLWLAYTLSSFAHEWILFALTVHVYDLTGSALDMGIFTAVSIIPRIAAPVSGAVIDRLDRKRIFVACELGTAALVLLISRVSDLWQVYVLWFFVSTLFVVVAPTRVTLVALLAGQANLLAANSLMMATLNGVRIVAPAAAAFLALKSGLPVLLYVNATAYALAGISMLPVAVGATRGVARPARQIGAEIAEGIAFLFRHPRLRLYTFTGWLWRLFLTLQAPLFVVYVKNHLGRGTAEFGLFMTVVGVGSVVGSLVGGRLGRLLPDKWAVFAGLSLHYLSFAALGFTRSYLAALVLAAVSFAAFFAGVVNAHADRDRLVPAHLKGRVYSSISALFAPTGLICIALGTAAADRYGVGATLSAAGLLAVATLPAALYVFRERVPGLPAGGAGRRASDAASSP